MFILSQKSKLRGAVDIPASKSHTIRGVFLASLANGQSVIEKPLDSLDTRAAVNACSVLGAEIDTAADWTVTGFDGEPRVPEDVIDTMNSGTTLNIALGVAALANGHSVLTGDEQIRRRPVGPLIGALTELGAECFSTRNNGCPPIVVGGRIRGGSCSVEATSSQYLTSLLIAAPLAEKPTTINVPRLNERPYVEMTLDWLARLGIKIDYDKAMTRFHIPSGQRYPSFSRRTPADFSSATFFLCAAAITGGLIALRGLDLSDTQGDKGVIDILRAMGAGIDERDGALVASAEGLSGGEFDLNATPDALPALAVAGCFAEGETRLVNVAQARIKETDRITVMCRELSKMGARISERPDGLVIRGGPLTGCDVDGHGDHRVVMALAVAGLGASGTTRISTAESTSVTFPNFVELMQNLDGNIEATH